MKILFKAGYALDPSSGLSGIRDVLVEDGDLSAIAPSLSLPPRSSVEEDLCLIDAREYVEAENSRNERCSKDFQAAVGGYCIFRVYIFPCLVDICTHLCETIQEQWGRQLAPSQIH